MTLRVGILTYDFLPFIGGQGRLTGQLWERLRARSDVEVAVVSPAAAAVPGHRRRFGFTQRAGRHPAFSALATARARAWCRELRLDVLHVNGGPGGVLLLGDPGVPVVYSLYHTYAQVARLMPGHRWKRPVAWLERAAYRRASRIIASTGSTARSLRADLGLIDAPIDVVPCGVDFEAFPAVDVEREEGTVLFVGRLDHRKDPQLLLRAFPHVLGAQPDARLVMAGQGPLEGRLRALASDLGIASHVRFERFVAHDELAGWYQRAAVVAVPSRFEGFGLSAVEAQSCGACVVATDTEGLRDVIVNGATGVLAGPEPMAFGAAIARVLAEPARRAALGAAARAHARRAYAWPAIIERYVEVYRAAAAGGGAAHRRAA